MKVLFKKLLVYSFNELISDWIFIIKDSVIDSIGIIFFMPLMFLGFILDLPFGIRRIIKAMKEDIWEIEKREFGWHLFKVF